MTETPNPAATDRIVIVGAGQAAAAAAAKLRALAHRGPITLIGAEPLPPYQRPPLSKAYLLGEMTRERLFLRPDSFYAENDITLRLSSRAEALDLATRSLRVEGEDLPFDQLILATGATPRRLPPAMGGALPGCFVIRNMADIDAMEPELRQGRNLVIIGGGYIGLEAAAVAAKLGLNVTLIEAAPRILQRVACAETAAWFCDLHRRHGVDIVENAKISQIRGADAVEAVALDDGREIPADLVIMGIGVAPDDGLARAAGLACSQGIDTDAMGRCLTAEGQPAPGIWAAGDCTSLPYQGTRIRLESVGNAIDQAEAIAANIMGADCPYLPKPWFWSDQYDVKLQIAGLGSGHDQIVVRAGDAAPGAPRSHWYYRDGTLIAVDAMNDPRAYMVGKRLIEAGRSPDPAIIADPDSDLKPLLRG